MVRWIRFHVFTYESLYLYFQLKKVHTNFTAHGSAHEVRLIFMHVLFLIETSSLTIHFSRAQTWV